MDAVKFLNECDYTVTPIANAFVLAGQEASGVFGDVAPYIGFMIEKKDTYHNLYYPYVSLNGRRAEFGVALRGKKPGDKYCMVSANFAVRKVTVYNPPHSSYVRTLTERYSKQSGIMRSQADVLSLSCLITNELLIAVHAKARFKPEYFIDGTQYKQIRIPTGDCIRHEKVELTAQELMEALL